MTQRVRSEIHTRISPQLFGLIDSEMVVKKCTMSAIVREALGAYFAAKTSQTEQGLMVAAKITETLSVIETVDDSEFFDFE